MVQYNKIFVPDYQRAYSWDTEENDKQNKHVNTFLVDLEDYLKSKVDTPYYFGHFLYEKIDEDSFAIIDGQQRLTTIVIFICAIFRRISKERELSEQEQELFEDLVKRGSTYKFSTVHYDNQLFRDYVINAKKNDHYGIDTTSGKRIVQAFDYFEKKLSKMELEHVLALLSVVTKASCTTHIVNGEAEAIQMFIFQNNRGKKPSHLEIIKAQFMYTIHIFAGESAKDMIEEVKNRFEHIYRSISEIEDFVDEDAVLTYTLQVKNDTLWAPNTTETINARLKADDRLDFISDFTLSLDKSFNNISRLKADKTHDVNIEGALLCGNYEIAIPFFIKAYSNGCSQEQISLLGKSLGDILLRDRLTKTRADLRTRLNDVFKNFKSDVNDIIVRINWMKTNKDYWWSFWNNDNVAYMANANWDSSDHDNAKIILWKYENYLISEGGKLGYSPISYSSIYKPHLEHISPQTENEEVATGYDVYDEEFKEKFLFSIGNFLLLSETHNISIGNKPFEEKRSTYTQLRQQREIQIMTEEDHIWDREKISARQKKIVDFILDKL